MTAATDFNKNNLFSVGRDGILTLTVLYGVYLAQGAATGQPVPQIGYFGTFIVLWILMSSIFLLGLTAALGVQLFFSFFVLNNLSTKVKIVQAATFVLVAAFTSLAVSSRVFSPSEGWKLLLSIYFSASCVSALRVFFIPRKPNPSFKRTPDGAA